MPLASLSTIDSETPSRQRDQSVSRGLFERRKVEVDAKTRRQVGEKAVRKLAHLNAIALVSHERVAEDIGQHAGERSGSRDWAPVTRAGGQAPPWHVPESP